MAILEAQAFHVKTLSSPHLRLVVEAQASKQETQSFSRVSAMVAVLWPNQPLSRVSEMVAVLRPNQPFSRVSDMVAVLRPSQGNLVRSHWPSHSHSKPLTVCQERLYFAGLRSIYERKLFLLSGGLFFGGLEILRGNPGLSLHWRPVSRPKHSARKPWTVLR